MKQHRGASIRQRQRGMLPPARRSWFDQNFTEAHGLADSGGPEGIDPDDASSTPLTEKDADS